MKRRYEDCKTVAERVEFIREAVAVDAKWAVRGMLRVFDNQTADEQAVEDTRHHNGIGFTGADANFLSSLSKQVKRGRTLSPKQMKYVFKKMPKYAAQLEKAARIGKPDHAAVARALEGVADEADYDNAVAREEIEWKNEFAKREAAQEAEAFLAKMRSMA